MSQQTKSISHEPEPSPLRTQMQQKPTEFSTLAAELVFVTICSMGQVLFAIFLGDVVVNQVTLLESMKLPAENTPWIIGSFLLASGIAVVIFGSLADLTNPKWLMVTLFGWLTVWNVVGVFSIKPSMHILFFVVRAMQGLASGGLQATAISFLGHVYSPGVRKNRAFAALSAMTPCGFWIGCLKGGALSAHLPWIFASNAILCGVICLLATWNLPSLPASESRSIRNFDVLGSLCAAAGCGLIIFGLTQGVPSKWHPYTYSLILAGVVFFGAFHLVERRAKRPLVDNRLWKTSGFLPLVKSYFLGFGAYIGGWMFYAIRFFLTIQKTSPVTAALYMTPNVVSGILTTWLMARTLHLFSGHWILTIGMVAYLMGPVFFLPQTPNTIYWALSMPGITLVTLGPDLTFAAASIFITSSVPRSFQGSAGSVLITVQNIAAAIMTAVSDTIGERVSAGESYNLDLTGLRAIWWFSLGTSALGAVICAVFVRIPRSEEKEHVV
ncbi:hypothetical protein AJ79_09931 [Helicocarpus griseus UAMH5409]|uniref:Major facilitator superfamily (MFS) profile domain-containing protein n=1 Tax=Helicocarpus griseus UAMH5409 TaxID=1447875 RepID=A0A2B7WGL5_9EURO|nr:hypothetical protein AJ79_09931 [Helicocarpus griseus UAMH5409]